MRKLLFFIFLFSCLLVVPVLAADKIEINTASLEQLEMLTGIGPVKAQAIIDSRPFSSIDDLLKVKGIGEATLQKIKDQGLAYVGNPNGQILNPAQIQSPDDQKLNGSTVVEPFNSIDSAEGRVEPTEYPGEVYINEILPNPEGTDETDEWVELYNSNNFSVDLEGWKIKDTTGTTKTYTIGNLKILANGFLIFKRPDTKIMLNNDGDGLNLLTPNDKIVDSVNYPKAPLGQSYNKISGAWAWSAVLTPGAINIIPDGPSTNSESGNLQNAKKPDNNEITTALAANLSQTSNPIKNGISNGASPWFLFFTVLSITIILAVMVLIIKLKFNKKEDVRT